MRKERGLQDCNRKHIWYGMLGIRGIGLSLNQEYGLVWRPFNIVLRICDGILYSVKISAFGCSSSPYIQIGGINAQYLFFVMFDRFRLERVSKLVFCKCFEVYPL